MIGVNIIIPSVYNIGKEVAREQLPMKKIVLLIYTQTIKNVLGVHPDKSKYPVVEFRICVFVCIEIYWWYYGLIKTNYIYFFYILIL